MYFTNQCGDDLRNVLYSLNTSMTADLVDMTLFSRSNKGYKYLLTVIDVFGKYGWVVPLKTKTGKEVVSEIDPRWFS